jgi:hypothetical protein
MYISNNYTFETLKENMPKALACVKIGTIRRWEHRMHRWMEAYRSGLETKDAWTYEQWMQSYGGRLPSSRWTRYLAISIAFASHGLQDLARLRKVGQN